jgi:hypothetical protein
LRSLSTLAAAVAWSLPMEEDESEHRGLSSMDERVVAFVGQGR